jgi:CRISPR-associated protein Cas2
MIRVIVVYDIQNDRRRTKVCDTCLDYGLDRQQYSVFTGLLKARQLHALTKELTQMAGDTGHIVIFPVASDEWDKRVEIGSPLHVA